MRYKLIIDNPSDTCYMLDKNTQKRTKLFYTHQLGECLAYPRSHSSYTTYSYKDAFAIEFDEVPALEELKQKYPEAFV